MDGFYFSNFSKLLIMSLIFSLKIIISIISVMEYTRSIMPAKRVIAMVDVNGFAIRRIPHIIVRIAIIRVISHGDPLILRMLIAIWALMILFRINQMPNVRGIIILRVLGYRKIIIPKMMDSIPKGML